MLLQDRFNTPPSIYSQLRKQATLTIKKHKVELRLHQYDHKQQEKDQHFHSNNRIENEPSKENEPHIDDILTD